MIRFGEILRACRQASNDPDRLNRRLTQERLGELIGQEMGDFGFTGPAISYWESQESKINARDRGVLLALIKVLHRCGGLQTLADANHLLRAGNYSELDTNEAEGIFGALREEPGAEPLPADQESSKSFTSFFREKFFSFWNALLEETEKGPAPVWPRLLAAFMRNASERISLSPKTVIWIAVWCLAWWLMAPSLRWPFASQAAALQAVGSYVLGTVIIPLLIGMLINTKDDIYWQAQRLADPRLLRLYTYQGAGIGFNLGYFFVLPVVFIRYHLNLEPSDWTSFIAVTIGFILANMSARVVPHNLWLAYGRLLLKDGAIFFFAAFVGPLWGLFFFEYYPILLEPFWGSMVILAALLLFLMVPMGAAKKTIDPDLK